MRRAEEPVAGAVKVSDHEEGEGKKPHTSRGFMIARGKERKKKMERLEKALTCTVGSVHFPGQEKCRAPWVTEVLVLN